jgi:hypothetical protein
MLHLKHSAETWAVGKVDQKYFESFEVWCWRRMEKISRTGRTRNEVSHRVKEERKILHTVKRRKANWIGQIMRRDCLLKHVIEGKLEGRVEVIGKEGRRRKQLRKREDAGNGKSKHQVALRGELTLEDVMDLLKEHMMIHIGVHAFKHTYEYRVCVCVCVCI